MADDAVMGRPSSTARGGPCTPPSVAVLIASYQRPRDLARCLRALAGQHRPPEEVVVVVRDVDTDTARLVETFGAEEPELGIRRVTVGAPGLAAARLAELAACTTDIVAMADDDTMPHPDWVAKIAAHFAADPGLGGLGGRDRCHDGTDFEDGRESIVGRIQWFGREIGNHHLGFGAPRKVGTLKGANMSYRLRALGNLDAYRQLRGAGATPNEDTALSVAVRRSGWKLVYDPGLLVDHYAAVRQEPRHYVTIGKGEDAAGFADKAFNMVVAIWDDLSPPRRLAFAAWSLLIGTGLRPGFLQALHYTPRLGVHSWRRFLIAQRGIFAAYGVLLAARSAAGAKPSVLGTSPIGKSLR